MTWDIGALTRHSRPLLLCPYYCNGGFCCYSSSFPPATVSVANTTTTTATTTTIFTATINAYTTALPPPPKPQPRQPPLVPSTTTPPTTAMEDSRPHPLDGLLPELCIQALEVFREPRVPSPFGRTDVLRRNCRRRLEARFVGVEVTSTVVRRFPEQGNNRVST